MIENYFERIKNNSRPHDQFNQEWSSYSSKEFAEIFLPYGKRYIKSYLNIYDGAELFENVPKRGEHFLSIDPTSKLIKTTIYTFAKGQMIEGKIGVLLPQKDELFISASVNSDLEVGVKFIFGSNFKSQINTYLRNSKKKESFQVKENFEFKILKSEFQSFFKNGMLHSLAQEFVLGIFGVDKENIRNYNFENRAHNNLEPYKSDGDGFETVNFDAGPVPVGFSNSWTHGKITKVALLNAGYVESEILEIYYGNWLRDFSSTITAAALGFDKKTKEIMAKSPLFTNNKNFASLAKSETALPTHNGWISLIELFATKIFIYDRIATQTIGEDFQPYITKFRNKYGKLTKDILGVYRPEEHIDNPKGLTDESILGSSFLKEGAIIVNHKLPNSKVIKQTLSRGETVEGKELEIGLDGLKRYISEDTKSGPEIVPSSISYFEQQILLAAEKGGNLDGFVHFGAALHVLEDYYAHTNFVEISLIKVAGSVDNISLLTYPWVQIEEETKNIKNGHLKAADIQIVTGVFGVSDLYASLAPKLGNILFPPREYSMKKVKAGDRTLTNHLIIAVLSDYVRQEISLDYDKKTKLTYLNLTYEELLSAYQKALDYHDDYVEVVDNVHSWLDEHIPFYKETREWVQEEIHELWQDFTYYPYLVMSQMFSGVTGKIKDAQTRTSPNFGDNPTHTQIAKDHLDHKLNPLAGQLAVYAVEEIGLKMKKYWKTRDKKFLNDILNLAKTKYFVHPTHTEWMDQYVINWVLKNSGIVNNIKTPISNEHDHGFDKSKIKAKKELDEMFPIKKGN